MITFRLQGMRLYHLVYDVYRGDELIGEYIRGGEVVKARGYEEEVKAAFEEYVNAGHAQTDFLNSWTFNALDALRDYIQERKDEKEWEDESTSKEDAALAALTELEIHFMHSCEEDDE